MTLEQQLMAVANIRHVKRYVLLGTYWPFANIMKGGNPEWPPRSPHDALLSTPGGRDRLRRLAERTSPSPSPLNEQPWYAIKRGRKVRAWTAQTPKKKMRKLCSFS